MALIAKCNVGGFNLSSVRKIKSVEPEDAVIVFDCRSEITSTIDEIKAILEANISGEIRLSRVTLPNPYEIHIYIEFMNNTFNDDYAYDPNFEFKV